MNALNHSFRFSRFSHCIEILCFSVFLRKRQNQTDIFAATTGGAETMAGEMAVPFLGRLPLDPRIGLSVW